MNYSTILKCLREYFGAECTDDGMMPLIEKWREWYSGTSEGFHKIFINNGLSTVLREMFRLNMAKRVCEDWANLLLQAAVRRNLYAEKTAKAEYWEKTPFTQP